MSSNSQENDYNQPNDSIVCKMNETKELTVKAVNGDGTNLEVGDKLYPQMGKYFNPSNLNAHPIESGDGRWISVRKQSSDGEYKGICKLRVDDGLHVSATNEKSYIEAE
jgi:hypothetical protein